MANPSSPSSSASSCDEESAGMAKIRDAVAPEFGDVFARCTLNARARTAVTDMEVCRNGFDSPEPTSKPPSVREQWSSSREAPEVNVLKVTKGFQNHVAMKLGTIIDSSIKEVNRNLSTIHLSENASHSMSPPEAGGIRIFSHSAETWCSGVADSDESSRTNLGEKGKDDSETDRTKGLTESEVQLSDKDLTVRKRRKRKKRRPNKELDYQSESACELPSDDVGVDDAMETTAGEECNKPKKRKRAKEMTCMYQKKTKRRKLDTDSGGDGDVSSDTDTDLFSPPSHCNNEMR